MSWHYSDVAGCGELDSTCLVLSLKSQLIESTVYMVLNGCLRIIDYVWENLFFSVDCGRCHDQGLWWEHWLEYLLLNADEDVDSDDLEAEEDDASLCEVTGEFIEWLLS